MTLRLGRARLGVIAALGAIAFVTWSIAHGMLGDRLEAIVARAQHLVVVSFDVRERANGISLYLIAFAGGLAASLSPCILGMLPINLAYIGAARSPTRAAAIGRASQFVAGVIVTTSAVGLFTSLFFALFVTFRGFVNIGVGALTTVMALWLLGILRIPLQSIVATIPARGGPFLVGLVFALVASPCASPILVAVLAKAAASGSLVRSAIAMIAYAVGYTLVLWLASVFAGVAVASRKLLVHGELIGRIAAISLLIVGGGTIVYGISQL